MRHKDDYIVSAWRELRPSAIIVIPSTNVEVCCRMSLVDEEGK